MIKVVFCGTPQIAVESLEYLFNSEQIEVVGVVTQQDKPSGRGNKLTPPPIKISAEKLGLPVFQPKSIRKETDIQEKLKALNPDFFVTFAFGQILSQEEMTVLINDLFGSSMPSHTPDGSPVIYIMNDAEIDRNFVK